MLSTNGMFKSALHIHTVSCEIDLTFDFSQSEQNILFGGSNCGHLYFSSQLCRTFCFGNFNFRFSQLIILWPSFIICSGRFSSFFFVLLHKKMLKAYFVLTSLCIHIHQEKSAQLPPIAFIQTSVQERRQAFYPEGPQIFLVLLFFLHLITYIILITWSLE